MVVQKAASYPWDPTEENFQVTLSMMAFQNPMPSSQQDIFYKGPTQIACCQYMKQLSPKLHIKELVS